MGSLPWKRVRRALFNYAKVHGIPLHRLDSVSDVLPLILGLCGSYSQSRHVAYRIGIALLRDSPHILVTTCPDYSHHQGKFTYRGLGDGVPMLVERRVAFLKEVAQLVPNLRATFLIADHEADIPPLCEVIGVTRDEFMARVDRSIIAARDAVARDGWQVAAFTKMIPDFSLQVDTLTQKLLQDGRLKARFDSETLARSAFYRRVGYPPAFWHPRTVGIAAQYVVLGRHTAAQQEIVCNHHTISLGWFITAGNAFLDDGIVIH